MDSPAYTSDNDSDNGSVRSVRNTVHLPTITDLSGVPICAICQRLLEEDQPKIKLLCHHSHHTACFLTYYYEEYYAARRCPTCEAPIFADVEMEEVRTIVREKMHDKKKRRVDSFREKIFQNKELLKDLKFLKKQITASKKSAAAFRRLGRRYMREFNEETNAMKEILTGIKKRQKEALMKSPELKEWRKHRTRAQYYMRMFDLKYRDSPFHTLNMIPELRLPNRWHLRNAFHISWWTIDRWLRIRI